MRRELKNRGAARRRAGPDIILGPLLHARGAQAGGVVLPRWRLSATVLLAGEKEPPDLRVEGVGLPVPPRFLHDYGPVLKGKGPLRLWRYDFAVPRGLQDSRSAYGFDGDERRWYLDVPGTAIPPRIAYTACGGCEDEAQIAAAGLSRNARWGHLLGRHRASPFHLILMGGDQVYADGLWENVPELAEAAPLSLSRRAALDAPAGLDASLDRWFLQVYRHSWTQPEAAAVLASVPGLRMWDDHDILDGWGSHPEPVLDSPLYRAIYAAARRAFRLFQVGMPEDDPAETLFAEEPPSFTQGLVVNGVGVLALDLRSERRPTRVMSSRSLEALPGWLERFRGCRHLLLMSSVPLIFPSFSLVERLLNWIPGRQAMEDDLRDQWRSPAHREEWEKMLRLLAGFMRESRCRVTVLSGEVHLGAVGVVRGLDLELWQLVSSGIVHPAPTGLPLEMLERAARRTETLFDGLTLEMPGFPETGRRLLGTRNWLSLNATAEGDMEAEWHAESGPTPLRLTIPGL